MDKKLTKEELAKIMEAYQKAAERVGRTIKLAELYSSDEEGNSEVEILVDNREETDLN